MEESVITFFNRLRLSVYRSICHQVRDREGSLSATEAYSVDVIYLLGEPTMKEFASFLGFTQSNATYKVNSLVAKGYITKCESRTDKREVRLRVTEKFHRYYDRAEDGVRAAADRLKEKHDPKEIALFMSLLKELGENV